MSDKSKVKKSNKKISTGTDMNSPLLGISNKGKSTNDKKNANKGTSTNDKKNANTKELYDLDTFEGLEQKTKDLKNKLDKIITDFEKEQNLTIQDTQKLNKDVTNKCLEANGLSNKNKKLISKLKDIQTTLDKKMKLSKKFFEKNEKFKQRESLLQKRIKVKEKEIKNQEKNEEIANKDYNFFKKIERNNSPEKQNELMIQLDELEKEKTLLENENKDLRKILEQHLLCKKLKQNLNSKLNLMTNEYQFELKKSNMFDSNIFEFEEKKENAKRIKEEKVEIVNRSISYCAEIRKNIFEKMNKKKSDSILVSDRAALHISNLCESIGEQYKIKSGDLKNRINDDHQTKQTSLFNEDEQVNLATIIPSSYLNELRQRFDTMEGQRLGLIGRMKKIQDKQNDILVKSKIKLNYESLKKKEKKSINIDLKSDLAKKNMKVSKLKAEINKIERELKNWNKILKMKSSENSKLSNYVDNFEKNKKNRGEKLSDENLKQNKNIDLEYIVK